MPIGVYPRRSIEERFWAKVNKKGIFQKRLRSRCWEWTGTKTKGGYGEIRSSKSGSESQKILKVHRLSWELHNGKFNKDLNVLHKCDNPCCVNPKHLFLGTDADNVADKVSKDRQSKGEINGASKLTEAEALEILRRRRLRRKEPLFNSSNSLRRLALEFGVSTETIRKIGKGLKWKHL